MKSKRLWIPYIHINAHMYACPRHVSSARRNTKACALHLLVRQGLCQNTLGPEHASTGGLAQRMLQKCSQCAIQLQAPALVRGHTPACRAAPCTAARACWQSCSGRRCSLQQGRCVRVQLCAPWPDRQRAVLSRAPPHPVRTPRRGAPATAARLPAGAQPARAWLLSCSFSAALLRCVQHVVR